MISVSMDQKHKSQCTVLLMLTYECHQLNGRSEPNFGESSANQKLSPHDLQLKISILVSLENWRSVGDIVIPSPAKTFWATGQNILPTFPHKVLGPNHPTASSKIRHYRCSFIQRSEDVKAPGASTSSGEVVGGCGECGGIDGRRWSDGGFEGVGLGHADAVLPSDPLALVVVGAPDLIDHEHHQLRPRQLRLRVPATAPVHLAQMRD